ncbi:neuroglobin-like [Daphnia carinata]|uniref:neuroglobin-like n=1 Tax=Daphnia carinata TaxID=120202 RepID=UPI00257B0D07|nr:neuroglobin-like [Daphnia carinata]XP_057369767.1 neuroglobin-like [Daphnia carinata]
MSHTPPDGNEVPEMQKKGEAIVLDNDNPIDPVTGLSRREKDYVQHSWNLVRQDLKAAGLGFFHAFFHAHPEYKEKFKKFTDIPADKLIENRAFQVHAMSVMNAVTMVVDTLDDVPKLVNALKNLGTSHGRHNIQVSHFRSLAVVLVAFLESALGPELFQDDVKQSWIKALDVVVTVVATGLPHTSPGATESTAN